MNNFLLNRNFLASLAAIFLPTLAYAHTGLGTMPGFGEGLGHPWSGTDHMVAMVAVGIWAFQSGGKGVWAIPTSFVAMMLVGGILGFSGVRLPFVEQGIFMSILVFGILIAAAAQFPLLVSMMITGAFAIFHGHSHGTEIPAAVSGLFYSIGFIAATTALHLAGIAAAFAVSSQESRPVFIRFAGVAIALSVVIIYF
ncbi:Protein HupE [Gammaproteobacteria bacterium]